MNNKVLASLGISACVVACAATLALPALWGVGALGAGGLFAWTSGVSLELIVCLLAALGIGAGFFYWWRQQAQTQSCASDGSCGCNRAETEPMKKT